MCQIKELNAIINKAVEEELLDLKRKLLNYSVLNAENVQSFSENLKKSIDLRSRFLVQEICKVHTNQFLKSEIFQDIKVKNRFYKEDISEKTEDKFLKVTFLNEIDLLNLHQLNNLYTSLSTLAGTATVGGIIKYVLQNKIDVPIWTILVGSLIVGGVTFFSVVPAINKSRQEKAIDEFFVELKAAWLDWLKEVEAYYLQEVENFKSNSNLQEV